MPLYLFNTEAGSVTNAAKAEIAADLTRIYSEVTGAPGFFVNAFFFEEHQLIPLEGATVSIRAGTRKGWTDAQKSQIAKELKQSINRRTGISVEAVHIAFQDTPARWAMEGGDIIPEPGNDAEWIAARQSRGLASGF